MGKQNDDPVALKRYQAYEGEGIEKLMQHIKQGRVRAGRYADRLKLKTKAKELK